jgi:allantoinase
VHVLHLSSAATLPALAAARRRGVRVTAETCPHYLSFAAAEIPAGATQFKCCPPIRDAANRDALWQGLRAGEIDCVVSDHSPCTAELKHPDTGDFATAWGGIASLQLGLPAVWTGARARGVPLTDVVAWMAARPAALAGLARKGALAPGRDADLCVFAPDDSFVVDAATLEHRNPVSAYHGKRLTGVVRRTWLRGAPTTGGPGGRLLSRAES